MDRHFRRLKPLPGEEGSGCYFIGAAIASGLPSIIGGVMGSSAAEDASDAQKFYAKEAIQRGRQESRLLRRDINPYVDVGTDALRRLQTGVGLGPAGMGQPGSWSGNLVREFSEEDFRTDPGYQFRLEEGEKAIDRAAAARGQWQNPATVKELQRYGGGLADQTYQDAFNRYQAEQGNRFNRLFQLMGAGQRGVDQLADASRMYLSSANPATATAGEAAASGELNAANALISGLTGGVSGAVDQYNINRLLRQFGGQGAAASVRYPGTTYPGPGAGYPGVTYPTGGY